MTWDSQAIRAGAGVCLVFAAPFSVGARVAADADNTGLAVLLSLGAVVGFLIGAGCAAWLQRAGTPLSHGIVTAVGTYLVAQAVFIVIRLLRADSVSWFAALFNMSIVLGAGLLGGLLGQRLQSRGITPTRRPTR